MGYKYYSLTANSAATGTNKIYIGSHTNIKLHISAMTSWNAGAGNATISIRGGFSESDSHVALTSMNVATETIKNFYHFDRVATPFISIGLNTAITGSANQVIADVIVFDERGSN